MGPWAERPGCVLEPAGARVRSTVEAARTDTPAAHARHTAEQNPGTRLLIPPLTLTIKPLEPHYPGPLVVLVDNETISSGEGIPMAIQRLPQGVVIGVAGTADACGMSGGELRLPEGYTLYHPIGQSLDARHRIQLDSDHLLRGGVVPDIRVPWTEETVRAAFVDGADIVLDHAVRYLQDR